MLARRSSVLFGRLAVQDRLGLLGDNRRRRQRGRRRLVPGRATASFRRGRGRTVGGGLTFVATAGLTRVAVAGATCVGGPGAFCVGLDAIVGDEPGMYVVGPGTYPGVVAISDCRSVGAEPGRVRASRSSAISRP